MKFMAAILQQWTPAPGAAIRKAGEASRNDLHRALHDALCIPVQAHQLPEQQLAER